MKKVVGILLTMIMIVCNCMGVWAAQAPTTIEENGGTGTKDVLGSYSVEGGKDLNGDGVPDTDFDGDNVADDTPQVDENGDPIAPDGAVFNIDIAWGNLLYDYKVGGTWDSGSHSYTGGTNMWVPRNPEATIPSDVIKVTNNSNVAVNAKFEYTKSIASVTGTFTPTNFDLEDSVGIGNGPAPFNSTKLALSGDPGSISPDTKLGEVTVKVYYTIIN